MRAVVAAVAGVRPRRLADRRGQHERPAGRASTSPMRSPATSAGPRYSVRPDALVLAEHGHDATGDLDGDGWHGTMNYYGFSFPVWEWLRDPDRSVPSFGLPVGVPRRDGAAAVGAIQDFTASFGWRAVTSQLEHPRLPRLAPDPDHDRVRRAPARGRGAAVHAAGRADDLRRRRARPGGRRRRGLPPDDALAGPGLVGHHHHGRVRRPGPAAARPHRVASRRPALGPGRGRRPWRSCASTRTAPCSSGSRAAAYRPPSCRGSPRPAMLFAVGDRDGPHAVVSRVGG